MDQRVDRRQILETEPFRDGEPVRESEQQQEKERILEKYNARKLGWLHDSLFFILLAAAAFILFRFVIGLSFVSGNSMDPSLVNGELVLYLRPVRNYQAGDVISMRVPSGDYYVKRVVAAGGDVVDVRDGKVYVNDILFEDPFSNGKTWPEAGTVIYPYTVRPGNVFVLGDNREVSLDSRTFGEVNLRQIKGKILLQAGLWYIKLVT